MFASKGSIALAVLLGATSVAAQWESGPCTYHDYEGDKALLGFAYDSSEYLILCLLLCGVIVGSNFVHLLTMASP